MRVQPRLWLFSLAVFISCSSRSVHHSAQKTDPHAGIHRGMNYIDVLKQIGFPTKMDDLGTITDSLGFQTHTIEYIYGDNIIITMVNDTVASIDTNAQQTMQRIQHIMDSAKAAQPQQPFSISPN
jgi:hypothetical protein